MFTVKPLNKGHVRDNNINSHALSLVGRMSSSQKFKLYSYILNIGKQNFQVPRIIQCREVYDTVSLSRRVHYQRFYCVCIYVYILNIIYIHLSSCMTIYSAIIIIYVYIA